MNKFTEEQIRAVRGAKVTFEYYWVHIELFVNGNWITPYVVNKEKLKWHNPDMEIRPTIENMQEYAARQLKIINELLETGYELVSYEEYKQVIHMYHNPIEYTPNIVYLSTKS